MLAIRISTSRVPPRTPRHTSNRSDSHPRPASVLHRRPLRHSHPHRPRRILQRNRRPPIRAIPQPPPKYRQHQNQHRSAAQSRARSRRALSLDLLATPVILPPPAQVTPTSASNGISAAPSKIPIAPFSAPASMSSSPPAIRTINSAPASSTTGSTSSSRNPSLPKPASISTPAFSSPATPAPAPSASTPRAARSTHPASPSFTTSIRA